ncbi:MAG: hypothetical protein FJW23_01165 [Acidimicrobiia bacterium]|nr:hypothetical protein [Acidimicrobiia bacterium]
MSEQRGKIGRRALLKLVGAAGASATVVACRSPFGEPVVAQGVTGAGFEKSVRLATSGPGGNPAWQPGDAVKFLPPEAIPTRGEAAGAVAALPKPKLLDQHRGADDEPEGDACSHCESSVTRISRSRAATTNESTSAAMPIAAE